MDSHIESGPFDGGCLIVARAIIKFVGKGKIVRIISNANHDQTQHYGALINNRIYDADGEHANWQSWIKYFSTVELVQNQQLGYAMGVDPHSSIPDSEELADQLAAMFASRYASM